MLDTCLINFSRSIHTERFHVSKRANCPFSKNRISPRKNTREAYDSMDVQERESLEHSLKPIIKTESETAGGSFAHEIIKKRKGVEKSRPTIYEN